MFTKLRLHFAELDSESANLDLMIDAAEILDVSIRQIANEIASSIETAALGTKRIFDKTFSGQFGLVEIATGETRAANKEFTGNADRHGLKPLIEDEELFVRQRASDLISATASA